MPITQYLRKKAIVTAETMRDKKASFMEIEGAKGFFISTENDREKGVILSVEIVDDVKYFIYMMMDR